MKKNYIIPLTEALPICTATPLCASDPEGTQSSGFVADPEFDNSRWGLN